jgi:metallo-beta-lactamase class B
MRFLIIISCFINCCANAQQNTLKISHLTGDFYVFTTWRPFKGVPVSSHGLYFITEKGAVMIDTPWDTTKFQPLLDSIKLKHNKKVILCIATHSHEDRTGGLEFLKQKGVKTFTSKHTDEICKEKGEKRSEFTFLKDTTFKIDRHQLQTFYAGEGHTKDNLVIWFPKEKILYGGCLIKSTEAIDLGNLTDANVKAWPETLKKIKQKFPKPNYIITGHQDWSSAESINHTLKLLEKRAAPVLRTKY